MTTPILALDEWTEAQAQPHVTVNEAVRWLECFGSLSVLSQTTTTPPPTPSDGDRYIVGLGATGEWSGQDNNVALRIGTAWAFREAPEGTLAYVADVSAPYRYVSGAWTEEIDETGGGGGDPTGQMYQLSASISTAAPLAPRFLVPVAGHLQRWALHAEGGPGDVVVDIRRSDAGIANPPSGAGDSICGGVPPTLTDEVGRDQDCSDFAVQDVNEGDILEFVLVSFDTVTAVHIQLNIDPD